MLKTSSFTCNIPQFFCLLRAEYLYDLQTHQGEFIPVLVFGADSLFGRAIGFDCLTNFGGMFARLPISALVWKQDAPQLPLDWLQLWSCFSYHMEAHEYSAIGGIGCEVLLKDQNWYPGEYMFTFSWWGDPYAEDAGEGGFKRAVMVKLDNGCFCLSPYNRMKFHEMSFVTKPFPEHPDFLTNSTNWAVEETDTKWATEDSDRYYYNIKEKP